MKMLLFSACIWMVSVPMFGDEAAAVPNLTTVAATRQLADKAVAFVKQEKFPEAYDLLKPYWPLPAVEIDGLANQMNTQWPMVKQRFGASLATEFVRTRKVGESFIEYTYIQKFERHALRWKFVFYKPVDHWLINAVSWDDEVRQLFE